MKIHDDYYEGTTYAYLSVTSVDQGRHQYIY